MGDGGGEVFFYYCFSMYCLECYVFGFGGLDWVIQLVLFCQYWGCW